MVASLALAACAHNVKQDKATGPDGKADGAQPIELAGDVAEEQPTGRLTGKVDGIVTYPGGDRVDWKMIELPAAQRGKLALKMSWRTPRPGLQVAFDVFDERRILMDKVEVAKLRRSREATIADAHGKYFVRIYAPNRGDAGAYELLASFKPDEVKQSKTIRPEEYPVPDPPKLADVPAAPPPAVPCRLHDPNNPECDKQCAPGAPEDWPECVKRAANKPPPPCNIHDVSNPNCHKACALGAPPNWPACLKAMTKRSLGVQQVGDEVELTVPVGSNQGVTSAWRARLLSGSSNKPLANGTARITTIDVNKTKVRVRVTYDQAVQNPFVELTPPPP